MIRINLLPFRAARRAEDVRMQVRIFVLSFIFLALALFLAGRHIEGKVDDLKLEQNGLKKELKSYAATTKKINDLKNKIQTIEQKMKIISDLRKNRTGPVRLLDEVAAAVPPNKLWLNSLVERSGKVNMKGMARDYDTVALFMTNLKNTSVIKSVDLQGTKLVTQGSKKENKTILTDFNLDCMTLVPKPKKKAARGQSRGRR